MFKNSNNLEIDTFNPATAFRLLGENCATITEVGEAIIAARNELIIKEAQYIDAKVAARTKRMAELSATAANSWVEVDTAEERKALLRAEARLKNLQEKKDIIVEVHNALKVQIKLWEVEYKNINYAQS